MPSPFSKAYFFYSLDYVTRRTLILGIQKKKTKKKKIQILANVDESMK